SFEDEDIIHVEGTVDPVRDMEIIHEELRLKDVEMIIPIIDKLEKTAVRGDLTTHYTNEGGYFTCCRHPSQWLVCFRQPTLTPQPPCTQPPSVLFQPAALPNAPQTGAIQARQVAAYCHNC
ncbi:hypothetical protein GOODEAATRI_016490, partial [Goodea atripinnis]